MRLDWNFGELQHILFIDTFIRMLTHDDYQQVDLLAFSQASAAPVSEDLDDDERTVVDEALPMDEHICDGIISSQQSIGTIASVSNLKVEPCATLDANVFDRSFSFRCDEFGFGTTRSFRASRKRSHRDLIFSGEDETNKRQCYYSRNPVVKDEFRPVGIFSQMTEDGVPAETNEFPNMPIPANLSPPLRRQREFYQLPKYYQLSKRLESRNLLLPSLKVVFRLLSRLDFVQAVKLEQVCCTEHDLHGSVLSTLHSVQMQRLRGSPSKKWMASVYEIVPPHEEGAHKAERLTRQAALLLLCTSILCHHARRNAQALVAVEKALFQLHMDKFLQQRNAFLMLERQKPVRDALLRLYVFFTELFTIIPLKANLEVCLLLLSFLESEGVHHQRGGTNADETYKFYREFLEYIDEQVMPLRRQMAQAVQAVASK